MSEPMTLEEALATYYRASATKAEIDDAYGVMVAHAERTVAARSEEEPDGLENYLKHMRAYGEGTGLHTVAMWVDTLTAERDAAREERDEAQRNYEGACRTVALMFAAATGDGNSGPTRGVVEDVADLKVDRDRLAAELDAVSTELRIVREHDEERARKVERLAACVEKIKDAIYEYESMADEWMKISDVTDILAALEE